LINRHAILELATNAEISSGTQIPSSVSSKQPDPSENTPNRYKEAKPDLPSHPSLFGHSQHSPHGPFQFYSCVIEAVIHLVCKRRRVADFITNCYGELFELADLGGEHAGVFVLVL
jgi:hypothetical protein